MHYYGRTGKFTARPGQRDELVSLLLKAADLLQRDENCKQYIVSTTGEPETAWVHEVWTDKRAHEASLESEDVKALIRQAMPFITNMSEQVELSVAGGKGL